MYLFRCDKQLIQGDIFHRSWAFRMTYHINEVSSNITTTNISITGQFWQSKPNKVAMCQLVKKKTLWIILSKTQPIFKPELF